MVSIFSDSTCDLSDELLARYDIGLIPLHINLGNKEYRDRIEVSPEEIFAWSDEHHTTPKTSAVSLEDAVSIMQPAIDKGNEAVVFCISESMSTTGNVLRLAAEQLGGRVSVIDSANLSTGIGLLVLEAAILAKEGRSRIEIEAAVRSLIPLVRASFVVDTLTYLHRGGRCSSVAALAGGVLRLHPRIVVRDGAMSADKKYRGRLSAVIRDYAHDLEPALRAAKPDRVFITHSGCDRAIVEDVRAWLASLGHFTEILETRAGGVISSHCGPGTLGVLFIAGE